MNMLACCRPAASLAMAAVAALASQSPSLAASASASLTNISLSVVDLNLNDGITAGFSFAEGASGIRPIFTASNGTQTDTQDLSQSGLNSPFVSVPASHPLPGHGSTERQLPPV
jgi:hypothetical protein